MPTQHEQAVKEKREAAAAVRETANNLNAALHEASRLGLKVDISLQYMTEHGMKYGLILCCIGRVVETHEVNY